MNRMLISFDRSSFSFRFLKRSNSFLLSGGRSLRMRFP